MVFRTASLRLAQDHERMALAMGAISFTSRLTGEVARRAGGGKPQSNR